MWTPNTYWELIWIRMNLFQLFFIHTNSHDILSQNILGSSVLCIARLVTWNARLECFLLRPLSLHRFQTQQESLFLFSIWLAIGVIFIRLGRQVAAAQRGHFPHRSWFKLLKLQGLAPAETWGSRKEVSGAPSCISHVWWLEMSSRKCLGAPSCISHVLSFRGLEDA